MVHPAHTPHIETQGTGGNAHLNWLRASVLGANDGIVSVSALLVGVIGATNDTHTILLTGAAGLIAGALSMAVGEYVSVWSQRDSENVLLKKERQELIDEPDAELAELAHIYEQKGLSTDTAQRVAEELTAHDALRAHAEAELRLDPDDLTNPLHAAIASGIAFTSGAVFPLLAALFAPTGYTLVATILATLFALATTGIMSARVSGTNVFIVSARVVGGGSIAMAATFCIGYLFGVSVA